MGKALAIIITILLYQCSLKGQHYLTFGMGFGVSSYDSRDFEHFRQTYNQVNGHLLTEPMHGFGIAEGVRGEIGYRYIKQLSIAVLIGFQSYEGFDYAKFSNGESRQLEIKMRSPYLEFEFGPAFKYFFASGILNLFLNRRVTLDSRYIQRTAPVEFRPLDGNYKSDRSVSSDIGLAVGVTKGPIILVGKIFYPLFTGGDSSILKDESQRKTVEGSSLFPRDYFDYLNLGDYEGVGSDIDGIKLLLSLSFAIRVKS